MVVIFGFEGQSHSIVAEEKLTRNLCKEKALTMRNVVYRDMQIPFYVDGSKTEKPIFESVYYVCVPTKLEPK